jgi:hypothetical protein
MTSMILIFNHGTHRKYGMKRIFNRESREKREMVLDGLESGIVKELLELRGMIG